MHRLLSFLFFFVALFQLQAQSWTGTWSTNRGDLRLVQDGTRVYGDFATHGVIEATFTSVTQELSGTFTDGNKTGHITFFRNGNEFHGLWGWTGKSAAGNHWSGKITSTGRPRLTNKAPAARTTELIMRVNPDTATVRKALINSQTQGLLLQHKVMAAPKKTTTTKQKRKGEAKYRDLKRKKKGSKEEEGGK